MAESKPDVDLIRSTGFLIVKVSNSAGGSAGGKVFAIPEASLSQFEITPENQNDIGSMLAEPKRYNVDYAVFWRTLIMRGSAG